MADAVSVRAPLRVDTDNLSLRRGFLDVHTPLSRISELQMSVDEQRAFLTQIIEDSQAERATLYEALGRPNKTNFTHYTNKKPKKRLAIRSGRTQYQRDADRYLQLGQKIQEAQKLMRDLKEQV